MSPDYYQNNGIPFIRTSEIKDPTINFSTTVFLSKETNSQYESTFLRPNDLVFTKIGAYIGDVALLPPTYPLYNFSQNVAGVSLKDSNDGCYLLAFLLTHFGQNQIKRSAMLSGQGKLELNDLRNYLIPNISKILQKGITDIIEKSIKLKGNSGDIMKSATSMLMKELKLMDWTYTNEPVSVKTYKTVLSNRRLDAEYYQPKYDLILNKILSNPHGVTYIENEFEPNTTKISFDKPHYNYIEIGDININTGAYSYKELDVSNLPANAKIAANQHDILVSTVRPNRGAVAILDQDIPNLVVSGAFTVLTEKGDYKKEILALLLRSQLYRELLLKWNIGSSYPVIKDEDILNLPIPIVPQNIQIQLSQQVQESVKLRAESKRLLEVAKKAVEIAIEENEENALKYITENGKSLYDK